MTSQQSQILVRTERDLHNRLLARAKERVVSLNELCLERLSIPSSLEGLHHETYRAILAKAELLLGSRLFGLVFYGSQARGEARLDSDWDFLVVIEWGVPLSRELYRQMDTAATPTLADNIEVHFTQLPKATKIATGFWSEIALDGIVLYEKDFLVSKLLNRVRNEIADGMIVRKISHGQAYWIHREVV